MIIKQLSIFLENEKGKFSEIAKLLGQENINMTAFTVSENSDFGILRIIVSDTEKAVKILRNNKYAVTEADVIFLNTSNNPGTLGHAMDILTNAGIFIEYMYAFSEGDRANIIIRPDDLAKCQEILTANDL